ncbi:type II toxin-antitoxin system VapC family toxin [Azoarcus sp. DN11]|uniref:type II toxin-antitoxin system VapC family toxin n=1 Tax=Azoarcus sp. DN11 TaxID=356837 RepID=UPI000EAC2136|nr:type II toxin-antitoxin system VapC family toxin [Azoarcus sp. DN11]AYH45476.1 twitching motility protein PilT [Azoarcus sp. DN11]
MRVVLDASAAVNLVMRTERAAAIIEHLERSSLVLAPSLFHSEVGNTLWKYVRAGALDRHAATERYEEAAGLVDSFLPDEELVTEALSAAVRHGHPLYDLLYVILARRHDCKLITEDRKLAALASEIDKDLLP